MHSPCHPEISLREARRSLAWSSVQARFTIENTERQFLPPFQPPLLSIPSQWRQTFYPLVKAIAGDGDSAGRRSTLSGPRFLVFDSEVGSEKLPGWG